MYHHPGEYLTDFCVAEHQGLYHLFHIRGERWTWPLGYRELDLGHAVSADLRTWAPLDPVVPAGEAGAWDEAGVWAPDIIWADGLFHLFYTGSNAANNQAIGLATSPDLYTWTKFPHNPVVTPGPWSDRAVGRDVAGRDAMVLRDEARARYLLYYTATMADGRACLALAESTDLRQWRDLGPTLIEDDRSYNRLESPYVVAHRGRYYLFYSAKGGPNSKGFSPADFAHFDVVYVVSDRPDGGWVKPANHQLLADWTCASEHPTFDGQTYMFYVIQEEIAGRWGASRLSDPKRIHWRSDGLVEIHEHRPPGLDERLLFDSAHDPVDDWYSHGAGSGDAWRRDADGVIHAPQAVGEHALVAPFWGKDFATSVQVRSSAGDDPGAEASLLLYTNPSAMAGYRVAVVWHSGTLRLYRKIPGQPDELLQSRPLQSSGDGWHQLAVTVEDGVIEVYFDHALQIVRHDTVYREGGFGLHCRGPAHFRHLRVTHSPPSLPSPQAWDRRVMPRHLMSPRRSSTLEP